MPRGDFLAGARAVIMLALPYALTLLVLALQKPANHQMTGAPRPVDQALGNDNT